jgi:hypothetical protein
MIINHNCCIKFVPLVIFIYDARSHIHHVKNTRIFSVPRETFHSTKTYDVARLLVRKRCVFYTRTLTLLAFYTNDSNRSENNTTSDNCKTLRSINGVMKTVQGISFKVNVTAGRTMTLPDNV